MHCRNCRNWIHGWFIGPWKVNRIFVMMMSRERYLDHSWWHCLCVQEKQLQVGMGITKLRQKVKEQQDRVGQKVLMYCLRTKRLLQIWSSFGVEVDMLVKHKLWEGFNSHMEKLSLFNISRNMIIELIISICAVEYSGNWRRIDRVGGECRSLGQWISGEVWRGMPCYGTCHTFYSPF